MAISRSLGLCAAATLAACASAPQAPSASEVIHYKTLAPGPICSPCDTLELWAGSDGRVTVLQQHYPNWDRRPRVVRRKMRVAPEAYGAFRERLQPYRRNAALRDPSSCGVYVTDSEKVVVNWRSEGAVTQLIYDFGCDPKSRQATDLRTAPGLLGIKLRNPLDPDQAP